MAIAFENVCKWCREDKPELLEEVLSKEFAPDTNNVGSPLDACQPFPMTYHEEGFTSLMICAAKNHIECLALLLDAGAGMDVASTSGMTALHFAARRKNLDCLGELITRGALVGAVDNRGNTALHEAAAHGDSLIVDMLLKGGASVDARKKFMQTPLHVAWNNNTSVAVALLEGGASVVAVDCTGDTALHHAVALDYNSVKEDYHRVVVDMLLERGASVDARNRDRMTPLHVACAYDNTCAAAFLLERGASVVAVDCDGNTALHHAVGIVHRNDKKGHHRAVVDMLLERGVSVDVRNSRNETPLHLASKCGNEPAVAALLQAGVSVDAVDADRNTALHNVAGIDRDLYQYGDYDTRHDLQDAIVLLLLMHGASVYARNLSRETPLITASCGSNDYIVRTLLNMGAEVDAVDRAGDTALHRARLTFNPRIGGMVSMTLCEFNASEDLPNNEGRTAAEIADDRERYPFW